MKGLPDVRLRQAVLAAATIEPLAGSLRAGLGLGEPFRDPGVGAFGLENVVFALGDCFLEIVAPIAPATAAARQLERAGGTCGYMAIFDLRDLRGARERAAAAGVRTVWQIDLPDIAGTHLHPSDVHGTIVSLDRSQPEGSWRWGGPDWTGRVGVGAPGRLVGVRLAVGEPAVAAARWAEILGVPVAPASTPSIELDGQRISFEQAAAGAAPGLVAIQLQLPAAVRAGREAIVAGAARIELSDLPA